MTTEKEAMLWPNVPRNEAGHVALTWDDLAALLKRAYPEALEQLEAVIDNQARRRANSFGSKVASERVSSKEEAIGHINSLLGGHKPFNPIDAMFDHPEAFTYWVFSELCYRVLDGLPPTRDLVMATMTGEERDTIVDALSDYGDTQREGYTRAKLTCGQIKDLTIRIDGAA